VAGVGPGAVADALPALAPLSLSSATRSALRARPDRLGLLRAAVRAELGLPDPDRPEFPPAGWVARLAVVTGSALALVGLPLLAGVSSLTETVENGGWRWLGAAVVLTPLARGARAAAALLTVDRRIALGRLYGAGLVADSATLLHGHDGWRRTGARFLERAGVLPAAGTAGLARFTAARVVAAVLVAVATCAGALADGRLGSWRMPEAVVPAVALGLGAWALVLGGQWLALGRSRPLRPLGGDVPRAVRELVTPRRPGAERGTWRRGAQLGWSMAAILLEAAVLAAALHGVGGDVPLLATATVYAVLHLLWALVPVTAAPGAADVALLLALTGLGAPLASACAAVFVFRLVIFWLPSAAGALLTSRFEHRFGM
jgi:undecaprenyl-diphosphatase